MEVSVIIINYNTFQQTCLCIKSVLQFTKTVSFEIILVDNASTECNPDDFKTIFPDLQLIKNPENSGFSKGNNLGIAKSTGKYIILLNSDVELLEDSIGKCCKFLEENTQIAVLSPRLIYPDGTIQYVAERFPGIKLEFLRLIRWNRFISRQRSANLFLSYFFDHQQSVKVDYVWGAFFMIRKQVIELLPEKKLDDKFFMYAEDMAWCYDIQKLGYEIWYYADTTAKHFHSYSMKKNENNAVVKKRGMMKENKRSFLIREKGRIYTTLLSSLEFLNSLTTFPKKLTAPDEKESN